MLLIRADDLAKNCTEVYNYDNRGNILTVSKSGVLFQQYVYDEASQVKAEYNYAEKTAMTYVYDANGNIVSKTPYTNVTSSDLSTATQGTAIVYGYGDGNWSDKLTSYNGQAISYDASGNPTSYRGETVTWNGRQLASMQLMQMRIEFTYDVDGLRTSKTIPNVDLEHKYYYVGNRLQYETISDSSALWYFYDADGNPSGIRYKNGDSINDYYFVCNWRGDVIQIYNASGTLVGSYTYDAWGKVTENATSADTQNITETNPIRYRGYYYDTETRLYYVNSRYYDPAVKRFVSSDDSIISTATPEALTDKNLFAYCDNNPVTRSDGKGNIWHIVIGAAVSGVLSATTQVIEQGGIHSQKDVAKAAVCLVTGAISGGVGATGIGVFASAGIDAGLTMVTSLGIDLIDNDFELGNVDWREIAVDTIDAGVTGLVFGKAYDNAIDDVVKKSQKAITKGKNKIIKGITSKKTASKVKGTIKTGQKLIRANRKRINKIKAWGSVLGSIVSTARSIVNKFRRR